MAVVLMSLLAIAAVLTALSVAAVCYRLSRRLTRYAQEQRQQHEILLARHSALDRRIEELGRKLAIQVVSCGEHCPPQPRRDDTARQTIIGGIAKAAGVALVSLLASSSKMAFDAENTHHASVRTAIGETSQILLPDRSLVAVNTDSRLTVDLTKRERSIALSRGEARFDVAKDPQRPFVVHTPHATIRALGTSFNVQLSQNRTSVTVLHGHVEMIGRGRFRDITAFGVNGTVPHRIELHAGDRAAVTSDAVIVPNSGPPVHRVQGWSEGRLIFRDETLADVVAEMNRYHEQPMRIADPHVAGHRITGSFVVEDRQDLFDYLHGMLGVRAEQAQDGTIVLGR